MLPWSRFSRLFVFGLSLALLAAFAPRIHAQTAHFSYAQSTIGSDLGLPEAVAVDSSDNVYIANTYDNQVLKEALSNGSYAQSALGAGLDQPTGVAVDSSGNVYIADTDNDRVLKETLSNGSYTPSTIGSGLRQPQGVAVDGSGNVYIADTYHDRVLKETLSNGSYLQSTVDSGLGTPEGVAVDGSGNVYIANTTGGSVLKETLSNGSYTPSTIASGLSYPSGVAVDGSGNIYIADTLNNRVLKETLSNGSYTQSTLGSGFDGPHGVAVDGSGNVYIGDSGNSRVLKLQTAAVNFNSVPAGGTSAAQTLTFTFDSAGSIAAPAVLTQGAPNLDFTDAGTGTCTTNGASHVYSAGDTCMVDVVFSPKYAGARDGAVVLKDASGAPITTTYVYGTGTGPQIGFLPPAQSTVVPSSSLPEGLSANAYGVAVDGVGNIYIADINRHGSQVLKETFSGGAYILSAITPPGVAAPAGVAVDGAGNVYFGDTANNQVVKAILSNGSYTSSPFITGLNGPQGVAVDGSGNVYIANTNIGDKNNGSVLKETFSGGGYTQSTIASGLDGPVGVAVDSAGNVYIVENLSGITLKETFSGGGYTQSTIASGLQDPAGVAVDSAGNVYIADSLDRRVVKESPSAGNYVQSLLASLPTRPIGMAVDSAGNVYIGLLAGSSSTVLKEDMVAPPSFSFAETLVGTESSDSPQSFTVVNNGNADLTLAVPGAGEYNPSISAGFTIDSGSTCPQLDGSSSVFTLASGATCNYGIDFRPVAGGTIAGSAVLTDNNLNAAAPSYATQTVGLSGSAWTPAEYIEDVMAGQVTALGLNRGQTNSLMKELNQAAKMFDQGKTSGAINNLEDFIAEVNDLESSGNLTSQQEAGLAALENEANTLIQYQ